MATPIVLYDGRKRYGRMSEGKTKKLTERINNGSYAKTREHGLGVPRKGIFGRVANIRRRCKSICSLRQNVIGPTAEHNDDCDRRNGRGTKERRDTTVPGALSAIVRPSGNNGYRTVHHA